jgi:hypothetical protein
VVWLMAQKSADQLVKYVVGVSAIELKETMRVCRSHSLDHGVQDNDWAYGGGDEQRRSDPVATTVLDGPSVAARRGQQHVHGGAG